MTTYTDIITKAQAQVQVGIMQGQLAFDTDSGVNGETFLELCADASWECTPTRAMECISVLASDGVDMEFTDSDNVPDTLSLTDMISARIQEELFKDLTNGAYDWYDEEEE